MTSGAVAADPEGVGNGYRALFARCPVVAAPLAEITDYPFRLILRRFTDGLVHTEMVATQGLAFESARTLRMIETVPGEEPPVGIQVMGGDDLVVARTMPRVNACSPAVIDINMACPVRKIVKAACGASLMDDPPRAQAVLRAVKSETDRPVGVKLRLGLKTVSIDRVADALVEAGADALTIHGRTAAQMYTGRSDRAKVLEVARRLPIPVVAAGDVFTVDDVRACLEGGAAGVLIARGMMGRPWFVGEARAAALELAPPMRPNPIEVALDHLDHVLAFHGESGIPPFRRHLVEYVRGLPGAARLRHALVTAPNAATVRAVLTDLRELLATDPARAEEWASRPRETPVKAPGPPPG